jgi:hypothetical protein
LSIAVLCKNSLVSGLPGLNVVCANCTTTIRNAHNTGERDIIYAWHPWVGRRGKGQRNATPVETIEAIRQLTLIAADDLIAGILNRNGLRTGNGNRWTRERVCTTRSYRKIPPFKRSTQGNEPWLNLTKAAAFLTVTPKTLRLAAQAEKIKHLHPLPDGPWLFKRNDLEGIAGQSIAKTAKNRPNHPAGRDPQQKPYSHQQHSEMGVMKQDCNPPAILQAFCGHRAMCQIAFH